MFDADKQKLSQRVSSLPQKTKHLVINQQRQQQQKQQYQQQNNVNDPLLAHYSNIPRKVSLSNKENVLMIISYINAMRTEANLSDNL